MAADNEIILFISDFDLQVNQIQDIYSRLNVRANRLKSESVSVELIESTGYWLHNLYSAYEDLFKIVASFWENSIESVAGYHIQLIKRMRLEIENVRPAMIKTEKCYRSLDELRGFRHVFRHSYSYGLDDERVAFLLNRTLNNRDSILEEINVFRSKITAFSKNETDSSTAI